MTFSSQEDSEVALGKFTLTQDITLNDLTLTIKSDEAIDFSKNLNNIELQKSSGITIGSPSSYEIIDTNTVKVFFDSAYFLRTSSYILVGNFKNDDNSYYYTYVDYINTSKGTLTYSPQSYLLSKTSITK